MKKITSASYLFVFLTSTSWGAEMTYFDSGIDFWGAKLPTKPAVKDSMKTDEKFPWKAYQNPENKEFFKEGDYTPPEPFMEIARNPTDENIKQWFEYIKKKNDVAARLQTRMQEYMAKNMDSLPTPTQDLPISSEPRTVAVNNVLQTKKARLKPDPERFRIRMYFDSNCPHCRKMFGVLKQFAEQGFKVEALQVDEGAVAQDEKVIPIGKADPKEVKKHGIQGVPFLLIADMKRHALLPGVQGYHDYGEMSEMLAAASR